MSFTVTHFLSKQFDRCQDKEVSNSYLGKIWCSGHVSAPFGWRLQAIWACLCQVPCCSSCKQYNEVLAAKKKHTHFSLFGNSHSIWCRSFSNPNYWYISSTVPLFSVPVSVCVCVSVSPSVLSCYMHYKRMWHWDCLQATPRAPVHLPPVQHHITLGVSAKVLSGCVHV